MKNKTIEILAESCDLPIGTHLRKHFDGEVSFNKLTTTIRKPVVGGGTIFEVDFSELPPLYPTKDMILPEEGIPFIDGNSRLMLVGEAGMCTTFNDDPSKALFAEWGFEKDNKCYELKRSLPKTITVCAECFKEACECVREEGWYRVNYLNRWVVRYWDGSKFKHNEWESKSTGGKYTKIDWNNPISVKPEGE